MRIDFSEIEERRVPGMNGVTGEMSARMYMGEQGKIIPCRIHPGGSIGLHRHETSDDVNYVLSGAGKAVCDGIVETLTPGVCHLCHKGSSHSILNDGSEDLVLFTVVTELAE